MNTPVLRISRDELLALVHAPTPDFRLVEALPVERGAAAPVGR